MQHRSAQGLTSRSASRSIASAIVFVADGNHGQVKEILAAGGYTTVNTILSVNEPFGIAVDAANNVYVAAVNPDQILQILAAGGYTTVNTIGSGFSGPEGVAVDGAGNVFVADSNHNAIKEVLAAGGCHDH